MLPLCLCVVGNVCSRWHEYKLFTGIGDSAIIKTIKVQEAIPHGKNNRRTTACSPQIRQNNYDRLELSVPKGEKEEIQQAAKQAGQSVNAYVYEAVKRRMEQEQATADRGVE